MLCEGAEMTEFNVTLIPDQIINIIGEYKKKPEIKPRPYKSAPVVYMDLIKQLHAEIPLTKTGLISMLSELGHNKIRVYPGFIALRDHNDALNDCVIHDSEAMYRHSNRTQPFNFIHVMTSKTTRQIYATEPVMNKISELAENLHMDFSKMHMICVLVGSKFVINEMRILEHKPNMLNWLNVEIKNFENFVYHRILFDWSSLRHSKIDYQKGIIYFGDYTENPIVDLEMENEGDAL